LVTKKLKSGKQNYKSFVENVFAVSPDALTRIFFKLLWPVQNWWQK